MSEPHYLSRSGLCCFERWKLIPHLPLRKRSCQSLESDPPCLLPCLLCTFAEADGGLNAREAMMTCVSFYHPIVKYIVKWSAPAIVVGFYVSPEGLDSCDIWLGLQIEVI